MLVLKACCWAANDVRAMWVASRLAEGRDRASAVNARGEDMALVWKNGGGEIGWWQQWSEGRGWCCLQWPIVTELKVKALAPLALRRSGNAPSQASPASFCKRGETRAFLLRYLFLMHSSRAAIRQSCRASNAFNVGAALRAAFSSGGRLRQEGNGQEQVKQKAQRGSYSRYEALAEQFGSRDTRRPPRRHSQYVPSDLEARQAYIEDSYSYNSSREPQRQRHSAPVDWTDRRDMVSVRPDHTASDEDAQSPDNPFKNTANTPRQRKQRRQSRGPSNEVLIQRPLPQVPHGIQRGKASTGKGEDVFKNGSSRSGPETSWKAHMLWIANNVHELSKNNQVNKLAEHELKAMREQMDYPPLVLPPIRSDATEPSPVPWEVDESQRKSLNPMQVLDEEIARFAAYIQPTPAERAARDAVIALTNQIVYQHLCLAVSKVEGSRKSVRTQLFGSERTGLATATSDIDLRVYFLRQRDDGGSSFQWGSQAIEYMEKLAGEFESNSNYICTTLRTSGRFPIINTQHKHTNVDIQIVSAPETKKQQKWTARYLEKMPHIRTLYLIIRTALETRGLVDVFNGGIGSYSLFWMIVAALERRSSHRPTTAAEQLRHFLDFYANFDTVRYGLTINPVAKPYPKHEYPNDPRNGIFSPHQSYVSAAHRRGDLVRAGQWAISKVKPLQPYLFSLQDPADPTNDLGRKSNAIKHILKTIGSMSTTMEEQIQCLTETGHFPPLPPPVGSSVNFLENLVGRCHETWAERRRRLEEVGRMVLAGRYASDSLAKAYRLDRGSKQLSIEQEPEDEEGGVSHEEGARQGKDDGSLWGEFAEESARQEGSKGAQQVGAESKEDKSAGTVSNAAVTDGIQQANAEPEPEEGSKKAAGSAM
jgi:non-canonical poly(A) RNA polymerase PAPD5/7